MTVALILCGLIVLAAIAVDRAADRKVRRMRGAINPQLFHWDDPVRGRVCKPAHLMHGPAIKRLIRERNGSFDD